MIAAIQLLKERSGEKEERVVTEFERTVLFEVPVNRRKELNFHLPAARSENDAKALEGTRFWAC